MLEISSLPHFEAYLLAACAAAFLLALITRNHPNDEVHGLLALMASVAIWALLEVEMQESALPILRELDADTLVIGFVVTWLLAGSSRTEKVAAVALLAFGMFNAPSHLALPLVLLSCCAGFTLRAVSARRPSEVSRTMG